MPRALETNCAADPLRDLCVLSTNAQRQLELARAYGPPESTHLRQGTRSLDDLVEPSLLRDRRIPPGEAWTEKDNIAFIEARCSQIMQVVFAEADTASLILRMARGTGFAREALARIDEHVVGLIEADVRAAIDRGVLRPFEPLVVAQFIVGGIEKIVVGALDKGHAPDFARVAREIAVLLSCGFLPGDRAAPLPV